MTREIGSVFNVDGFVLKVEREWDTCLCFNKNGDECFFRKFHRCAEALRLAGDCMASTRDDNTNVVFIEHRKEVKNERG